MENGSFMGNGRLCVARRLRIAALLRFCQLAERIRANSPKTLLVYACWHKDGVIVAPLGTLAP